MRRCASILERQSAYAALARELEERLASDEGPLRFERMLRLADVHAAWSRDTFGSERAEHAARAVTLYHDVVGGSPELADRARLAAVRVETRPR